MKNLFKIGFLSFALCLSLTSCKWFSKSSDSSPIDSNKIDSPVIDSAKTDTLVIDSAHKNIDSAKIKH